jgi:preprotein translocase subunit YajC
VLIHPAGLAGVAAAQDAATKSNSSSIGTFVLFAVLIAGAYLLLVRPARARQRKAMETRQSLEPGAEVVTTAGLIASVVSIDDDTITLEIAPGVHSRFLKGAVARVNPPAVAEEPASDAEPS